MSDDQQMTPRFTVVATRGGQQTTFRFHSAETAASALALLRRKGWTLGPLQDREAMPEGPGEELNGGELQPEGTSQVEAKRGVDSPQALKALLQAVADDLQATRRTSPPVENGPAPVIAGKSLTAEEMANATGPTKPDGLEGRFLWTSAGGDRAFAGKGGVEMGESSSVKKSIGEHARREDTGKMLFVPDEAKDLQPNLFQQACAAQHKPNPESPAAQGANDTLRDLIAQSANLRLQLRSKALEAYAREFLEHTGHSVHDVVLCEQQDISVVRFWLETKETQDYRSRCEVLGAENVRLRLEVAQLRRELAAEDPPPLGVATCPARAEEQVPYYMQGLQGRTTVVGEPQQWPEAQLIATAGEQGHLVAEAPEDVLRVLALQRRTPKLLVHEERLSRSSCHQCQECLKQKYNHRPEADRYKLKDGPAFLLAYCDLTRTAYWRLEEEYSGDASPATAASGPDVQAARDMDCRLRATTMAFNLGARAGKEKETKEADSGGHCIRFGSEAEPSTFALDDDAPNPLQTFLVSGLLQVRCGDGRPEPGDHGTVKSKAAAWTSYLPLGASGWLTSPRSAYRLRILILRNGSVREQAFVVQAVEQVARETKET